MRTCSSTLRAALLDFLVFPFQGGGYFEFTPRDIRAVALAPVRAGIVGDGARERERERDNKGRTSGAVCECEWARQLTLPKCSLCADLPYTYYIL